MTTSTQIPVAEFQVRFTGLDSIGGSRVVALPGADLGEAFEERDQIRVRQENYRLPADAAIWWRTGQGSWKPWAGENR